ncbi:DUF2313 domain-containing protein [Brevibacillus laterosporus]|nr:putative phage tail protein [Brevibacillus laterosporus]TPG71176.1 DUF2313 domain-containing protein [Brevibacillus laterosporus]
MLNKNTPMETLPDYYAKSHVFHELLRVGDIQFNKLTNRNIDVFSQFFPQTATWGLRKYEEILNLPTNEDDSLENRRAKVISKLSEQSQFTDYKIELIAKNYANDVSVQFYRGFFNVRLVGHKKSLTNLIDLMKVINEQKYSHISYNVFVEDSYLIDIETSYTKSFINWLECGVATMGDEL